MPTQTLYSMVEDRTCLAGRGERDGGNQSQDSDEVCGRGAVVQPGRFAMGGFVARRFSGFWHSATIGVEFAGEQHCKAGAEQLVVGVSIAGPPV